jgi:lipoprotein-anchoring transpeptidase ErfK/SrfK
VLPGAAWSVRGTLKPYVAGQVVTVRFYRGRSKLRVVQVPVVPAPTGGVGTFTLPFQTAVPGRVTVQAVHRATPQLVTLRARPFTVRVLALHAAPGDRGPVVRLLQRELAAVGYVVGQRGLYDARTARAVIAFRKVTGMPRTPFATSDVFRHLAAGGGRFRVRYPKHGKHVEADLSRQVLALIRGGRAERIYPISSGKPSTPTVVGSFRVYSKTPGYNAEGMYYSNYFIRGYAIHGYADVPVFAASHGCLRVPIPDAVSIYRWLAIGDIVDVYP